MRKSLVDSILQCGYNKNISRKEKHKERTIYLRIKNQKIALGVLLC